MAEGVDYAGDRPSATQLFAAGKRFVVRYGGPGGSWKHIDAAEARALDAAGLSLVANAEGAADGLLQGWNAGVSWASEGDAHFRSLGMPASKPIYLSVDFDVTAAQWPRVAEALRGAAAVIGAARVGVYGSYDAMQWARRDGVAAWFWQTYAWSSGRWAGHNHIEQYRNGVTLAGGTVDLCRSKTADYGQWTLSEEDDMLTPDQAKQLRDTHYTAAVAIPNPAGEGTVPLHVWANWMTGAVKALATIVAGVDEATKTQLDQALTDLAREVAEVPAETVEAFGAADSPELIAQRLRAALGDKAAAVGAILAQG